MLPRLASAAACVLALTLAAPTAAHAASRTFSDGPGDVWDVSQAEPSQVPGREQGDIMRTTFTHGQRQVIVRTTFAELERVGRRILIFTLLRTNTREVRELSLVATRRPATNRWRGKTLLATRSGRTIDCRIRHSIDYANNVAVVRVPRTCLDDPRRVQAKFGVATFAGGRAFTDNPMNHGPTVNLPPYTALLRRG